MKIIDRIYQYMAQNGTTAAAFEKKVGLSNGYLSKQLNRKADIGERIILQILDNCPEISVEWLLTGEGDMLKLENQSDKFRISEYPIQGGVPYYQVDFIAGFDLIYNNQKATPDNYIYVPHYCNADCWVDVTGDSMAPLIQSGDIVALKQIKDWQHNILGGEIYAIVTEQWRTIKRVRVVRDDNNKLLLTPINPEYDPLEVNKTSIIAIFQVLGVVKKIG